MTGTTAPPVHNIHLPRTLFGRGATAAVVDALAEMGVSRPLIVTDHGVRRAGLTDRLEAPLAAAGPAVVFDGVTENPVFADADAGAIAYRESGCDGVIALGGGSVIDVAKYVAVLATHPGTTRDYAGVADARIGTVAPLIALPTTAGTGSEANGTAGIHPDPASVAVGIFSPEIMPRLVILDPDLTLSLPPRLTAATGIDALSHCIEGYFSRNDPPFLNDVALDGARRAWRFVRAATERGDDREARSEMLLAGFAGGVAITMGLGAAHAIAITCGDQGFNHGILSGIGLIAVLDGVATRRPDRAEALRRALELSPSTSLAGAVSTLMKELGLPTSLAALGYRGDAATLAATAHRSFFNASAWHHPGIDEYRTMIAGSLT